MQSVMMVVKGTAYSVRVNAFTRRTSYVESLKQGQVLGFHSAVEESDAPTSVVVKSVPFEAIIVSPSSFVNTQKIPQTTLTTIVPLWSMSSAGANAVKLPNAEER